MAIAVVAVVADKHAGGRRPLSVETCVQRAIQRRREGPIPVFERDETIFVVLSDPVEVPADVITEYTTAIKQVAEVGAHSTTTPVVDIAVATSTFDTLVMSPRPATTPAPDSESPI